MKRLFLIITGIFLFVSLVNAQEDMRSVQVNHALPSLTWKGARLKNLPTNAVVSVEIVTDNNLRLFFLDETSYKKFPIVKAPLFKSDVTGRLTFTVQIPSTGNYYIVLDNSKNVQKTNVSLKVSAGRKINDMPGNYENNDITANTEISGVHLSKINEELAKIFIYESFPITVNKCGNENAYSSKEKIILCKEYITRIQKTLDDKEKTSQVLLFVVFHEIGHVLLHQWNYPFYDNESIADEFATVLLVMVGEKKQLRTTAEYFASKNTETEFLAKAFQDDRHPLSIQRARNIINWMNDRERLERWQTVFIPHMQTEVLKRWQKEGNIDSVRAHIEQELDRREN